LPVVAAASAAAKSWLVARNIKLFAARVDAKLLYTQIDWREPAAIVLGSEAEGLSTVWSGAEVTAVRLPMRGVVDSLNVSAAAAVMFYEAARQRAPRD
jgi:TrmH family RNA methyltransferase